MWVLELSSFQLAGSQSFESKAATILNISQDHLDWHGDMAAYGAAKARIYGQQAVGVLPRQDASVIALWPADSSRKKDLPRSRSAGSLSCRATALLLADGFLFLLLLVSW